MASHQNAKCQKHRTKTVIEGPDLNLITSNDFKLFSGDLAKPNPDLEIEWNVKNTKETC